MPSTPPLSAAKARELLRKNADLATWMAALGARGSAAAADLRGGGPPPPDDLIQDLGDAAREFAALRAEVFDAAASLGVQTPTTETVDSTRRLASMLRVLLEGLETAERQATQARARAEAAATLQRIAALTHHDDPRFAPLAACQARAAELSAALASDASVDPSAFAPFAALLTLLDGRQNLDDDRWGALEDTVATVFGRPLAVAATRGKLVTR
jgi:hypothetical protein